MAKKITKIAIISLSVLILIFLGVASVINIVRAAQIPNEEFEYLTGDANKVILFIGDGMGENQIKNSKLYLEKDIFFNNFQKNGYVTTHSKNTFWPTDSAAAATALATGQKVYNTFVAQDFGKDITSISEIAKANGLGVGIVTTDTLVGATPSGFSAHASNRGNDEEIINSQLKNNIDLYLGAGYEIYSQYKSNWEDKGYTFVNDYEGLMATNYNGKVIGSFESVGHTAIEDDLTLSILTTYAIEYFERNYPDGYFLMIEGAHIDKMNHQNNIMEMIKFLNDFDASIKIAYDELGDESNVCFIVTADHETGGLQLANKKEDISNELYTTGKHTHADVKYYIYQKDNDDLNKLPETLDNTNIFQIYTKLLNLPTTK